MGQHSTWQVQVRPAKKALAWPFVRLRSLPETGVGMRTEFRTKKHLGQHFLKDPNVIGSILDAINPGQEESIIEIGPGDGALTEGLIMRSGMVYAIDVDNEAVAYLENRFSDKKNFQLIHRSVLDVDLSGIAKMPKARMVGNLPYNLSSPILFHLLRHLAAMKDIYIMVQREVAERIIAQPGNRDYGRLSLGIQLQCHAEKLFDVGPHAFIPPPRVWSSVVRLVPRAEKELTVDPVSFQKLVRQAFTHRRKKLKNNLKKIEGIEDFLAKAGIDAEQRPEQISLDQYIRLTEALYG
ncbi:MAG: 16S rRNA (adenine(1518)-N(6)/adenine(1519)-N(6))-dimethyltransferase RsmA [Gammaproteobacteria bacterium]|nr:MAG: 16S rRNA (adenine(1518)-N(6)/adenine(1519)-N(6))-dimethyltransferase RsmA [Gammaproteobacteria bacterium]